MIWDKILIDDNLNGLLDDLVKVFVKGEGVIVGCFGGEGIGG